MNENHTAIIIKIVLSASCIQPVAPSFFAYSAKCALRVSFLGDVTTSAQMLINLTLFKRSQSEAERHEPHMCLDEIDILSSNLNKDMKQ